ncbi:MAG: RDD family protein [Actinobacteria bacterium]|nr:RDD family protein [Actinomycetota bacterium]
MEPSPGLVTPEAVPLDLPVAHLGSRGVAYLLDALLVGGLLVALFLAALSTTIVEDTFAGLPGWLGVTLALLLVFAVQLGYPIGFETLWSGRTPGKAALGLRVVTVEGAPVGFRHAAVRAALGLVDFQLTFGVAAVLTALFSRRTQRLGDVVAGTLVLRERTGAGSAVSERFTVPRGLEALGAQLDVTALGPNDYQAVRSMLQRAARLDPDTRRRLAERLADTIAPKVRPAPPDGIPAEAWLHAVAAAYQRRSRPQGTPPPPPPASAASAAPAPARPAVYRPTGWEDGARGPASAPSGAPRAPSGSGDAPPPADGGFTAPR